MSLKEEANSDYKEKKTDLAIKKVSAAIELHATNKILYSNRILMCLNCKNYDLALADCQIIRELDPKSMYIKGHYLRGLTLLKLKKYKNAASAFQTVVKLNPSFKKATDRLNECLKELEKDTKKEEKRTSSKQELLKQTFNKENDADINDDDEKKEESKEEVVDEPKDKVEDEPTKNQRKNQKK